MPVSLTNKLQDPDKCRARAARNGSVPGSDRAGVSATAHAGKAHSVTLRHGAWLADGVACASYREALARALQAADCGPQPGNAKRANKPRPLAFGAGGGR